MPSVSVKFDGKADGRVKMGVCDGRRECSGRICLKWKLLGSRSWTEVGRWRQLRPGCIAGRHALRACRLLNPLQHGHLGSCDNAIRDSSIPSLSVSQVHIHNTRQCNRMGKDCSFGHLKFT